MVHVAQHGHDRRARLQLGGVLVGQREQLFAGGGHDVALALGRLHCDHVLAGDWLHGEAELVGDDLRGGEVDDLVDRGQDLGSHELLDHLDRADPELVREVLDRQRRREDGPAVAVGLDLGRDGRLERGAGSLDRAGRERRRRVAGQPPLLQEVDQLLLADPKFACKFVCLHVGTTDYAARGEFETSGRRPQGAISVQTAGVTAAPSALSRDRFLRAVAMHSRVACR